MLKEELLDSLKNSFQSIKMFTLVDIEHPRKSRDGKSIESASAAALNQVTIGVLRRCHACGAQEIGKAHPNDQ